jgi:cytochrome c5
MGNKERVERWRNSDKGKAWLKAWRASAKGKAIRAANAKTHARMHPDKITARNAVNNAVRDGRLVRLDTCQRCDATGVPIEGHHENYDQPLIVEWLCRPCHDTKHHA